jgi:hypothetical protein
MVRGPYEKSEWPTGDDPQDISKADQTPRFPRPNKPQNGKATLNDMQQDKLQTHAFVKHDHALLLKQGVPP